MRPIPILMMIQHLDNGGTERHFHDLARGLDPSLFEVHVIHFGPGEMARRLNALGRLPVTHMPLERGTPQNVCVVTLGCATGSGSC